MSAISANRFGKNSHYFIPPTFIYRYKCGITPHICQVLALSQITGYRFVDWMKFFGFDLDLIFPLQLKIHVERTTIVTPEHSTVPYGRAPLGHSTADVDHKRFWYAKIGSQDAVVYPALQPGSIVRIDRSYSPRFLDRRWDDTLLWLVEHPAGLTCCHVKCLDDEHITLLPNRPPLTGWPLCLSREAEILGLVDLELWPRSTERCQPTRCIAKRESWTTLWPDKRTNADFSTLLRRSRARSGLTLRGAHEMTLEVARLLGDPQYGIALSLLSDYEAVNKLPRHVAKLLTLCIVYGIEIWELIKAAGISIDGSERGSLGFHKPDNYFGST